ncbi:transcriptional regulator, AraC family protein [Synechococcus sp. PCC 7335]|uniref:AraC family transcriptional regulator n=1 Tax=Synechococcus sp. (strain ATCC 29403 / PCC 7335) TaxID=91464 RepID=UPI00017EC48C|nr:AraC family transcriptional regulator [Synechococcus sp. PCC 7335]EDX82414.1 transcriptional regulator, AraC family protein [Synechococcus sp. PCC 7335]
MVQNFVYNGMLDWYRYSPIPVQQANEEQIDRSVQMNNYQDRYPSSPMLRSTDIIQTRAREVISLEYFEIEAGQMPPLVYSTHHILINLKESPIRVENWRDKEYRDFQFSHHEIVITPAGMKSGWHWHGLANTIVITIDPTSLKRFSELELCTVLSEQQLQSIPQQKDTDLAQTAVTLLNAMRTRRVGYEVMYEALSRVFLVKLIQVYGERRADVLGVSSAFTAQHYHQFLKYVENHYRENIKVADVASYVGMSDAHFSREFKKTVGQSPYQFIMVFRVERAQELLSRVDKPIAEVAAECGFYDQPHFTKTFQKLLGCSPTEFRKQYFCTELS